MVGSNMPSAPLDVTGVIWNETLNLDCHQTTCCLRNKCQSNYIKARYFNTDANVLIMIRSW